MKQHIKAIGMNYLICELENKIITFTVTSLFGTDPQILATKFTQISLPKQIRFVLGNTDKLFDNVLNLKQNMINLSNKKLQFNVKGRVLEIQLNETKITRVQQLNNLIDRVCGKVMSLQKQNDGLQKQMNKIEQLRNSSNSTEYASKNFQKNNKKSILTEYTGDNIWEERQSVMGGCCPVCHQIVENKSNFSSESFEIISINSNNEIYYKQMISDDKLLVQEITVQNGSFCESIIQILKDFKNARILRVQWQLLCKKKYMIQIIKNMKQLVSLHFINGKQFDEECIKITAKLNKLKNLYFSMDGNVKYLSNNYYFKEKQFLKMTYLSEQQTQLLISKIPQLQNICIANTQKLPSILARKQWQQLSIGGLQWQQIDCLAWNSLKVMNKLTSISFQNINNLKSNQFGQVLTNNCQSLKSITLNYCLGINDLFDLKKCGNLQSLYLNGISVNGQFLPALSQLTHLHLQQCTAIIPINLILALQQMPHLKYLDLCYNKWMNDSIMQQIGNLRNLNHLNLFWDTSITDEGFMFLKNLKELEMLNLGHTKISSECALKVISKMSNLIKLSLWSTIIDQRHISLLGSYLTKLTHLSIQWCRKMNGKFLANHKLFPVLRYVDKQYSTIQENLVSKNRTNLTISN